MTACILCARDLAASERQTCLRCLGRTRASLVRVDRLFALLPSMLTDMSGSGVASVLGRGEDHYGLPAEDVLVMLGPGSSASMWAYRQQEARPVWKCLQCGTGGIGDRALHLLDKHDSTAWTRIPELFELVGEVEPRGVNPAQGNDPPAVAFELTWWAQDWCEVRGEDASRLPRGVTGASGWLSARCGWAASFHPAFDEFAGDLRRIVGWLEEATGTSDRPERGAPCIYCRSVDLERGFTDAGRDDDWVCPRCRRAFSEPQYRLAVRIALEEAQGERMQA